MGWDQSDLNAYNARQAASKVRSVGTGDSSKPVAVADEGALHEQIFSECRRRGWVALHGAMSERTHRTLGEPDFVILAEGGRVLFVEAKSRTGKLSTDQQAMAAWARKLGHEIHVVRNLEEFLNITNQ